MTLHRVASNNSRHGRRNLLWCIYLDKMFAFLFLGIYYAPERQKVVQQTGFGAKTANSRPKTTPLRRQGPSINAPYFAYLV